MSRKPSVKAIAPPKPEAKPTPQITIISQYCKQSGFDSPNPLKALIAKDQPELAIDVKVITTIPHVELRESVLVITGRGAAGDTVLFSFRVTYAGVFKATGLSPEAIDRLAHIDIPKMLYPFAREIAASLVRAGGFPQILLPPADFDGMYEKRKQQN